jgi:undecaprenyl pyrophosphate phosphatase UppP
MTTLVFQAAFLGVIQGEPKFIPISSSVNLIFGQLPWLPRALRARNEIEARLG